MKDKKRIGMIAGIAGAILVCALIFSRCSGADNTENIPGSESAGQSAAVSTGTESQSVTGKDQSKAEKKEAGSDKSDNKKNDKAVSDTVTEKPSNEENAGSEGSGGGSQGSSSQGSFWDRIWHSGGNDKTESQKEDPKTTTDPQSTKAPTKPAEIAFPYNIPNRNLVVRSIQPYEGIFLENGSDAEVSGIAVMILENTGEEAIEYADFTFKGKGEEYSFECTDIPAGGIVVIQEKDCKNYSEGVTFLECDDLVSYVGALEMSEDKVSVSEDENGQLVIQNISGEDIPCVRVFYKFYSEEDNVYVGGITYVAKITDLEADGSRTVKPSHYANGYSRVMMVRTYDTAADG